MVAWVGDYLARELLRYQKCFISWSVMVISVILREMPILLYVNSTSVKLIKEMKRQKEIPSSLTNTWTLCRGGKAISSGGTPQPSRTSLDKGSGHRFQEKLAGQPKSQASNSRSLPLLLCLWVLLRAAGSNESAEVHEITWGNGKSRGEELCIRRGFLPVLGWTLFFAWPFDFNSGMALWAWGDFSSNRLCAD